MESRMEFVFVGDGCQASKTGVGCIMKSNAATWRFFRMAKRFHAVDINTSDFILDYYNSKGDLADSIGINRHGFRAITGEVPQERAYYEAFDKAYWNKVRSEHSARNNQSAPHTQEAE
jgi:hypothetical protein